MPLYPAAPEDLPAAAALVNSAYRGDSSRQGWTTEADLLGGQRTDPQTLADELAASPGACLMLLRESARAAPVGSVWLEPAADGVWRLGMLTVRPDLQDRRIGRSLLDAAEAEAAARGARRMSMTVISVRQELIAWYGRRGYAPTGERRAFPYGDARFGDPRRPDLEFVVLEKPLQPGGG
jgi:ribosomal protein S18 acetylase RimI-like enzyme